MYQVLLFGADAPGSSQTVHVQDFRSRPYVIAQVDITGDAKVTVEGRVSGDFDWVTLHEFTANDPLAKQVTAFPQMRFTIVSITTGTVDAAIAG